MSHANRPNYRFLNRLSAYRQPSDHPKSQSDVTDMAGIRAAAVKFVERFGDNAIDEAGIRAAELLQVGDYQGRARWQLIKKEVEQLLYAKDTVAKG